MNNSPGATCGPLRGVVVRRHHSSRETCLPDDSHCEQSDEVDGPVRLVVRFGQKQNERHEGNRAVRAELVPRIASRRASYVAAACRTSIGWPPRFVIVACGTGQITSTRVVYFSSSKAPR